CSATRIALHSFPTRRSSDLLLGGYAANSKNRVELACGDAWLFRGAFCAGRIWGVVASSWRPRLRVVLALDYLCGRRSVWSGLSGDRKSTRLNSSHDQISYAV